MTLSDATPPAERAPAAETGAGEAAVYGALDMGTSSCRLLVAEPRRHPQGCDSHGRNSGAPGLPFRVIDAYSRVVGLGEGLKTSRELSPAAMDRAIAALKVCAGKLRRRRVRHLRAVATEACRRADNGGQFCDRVERETGIGIEVISRAEEAQLALTGCQPLLDPARRHALVVDIGGGSTQISWLEQVPGGQEGQRAALRAWHSIPFGVVGVSEGFADGAIAGQAFESLVAELAAALAPFERAHGLGAKAAAGEVQMLGMSGTATILAGVHQGLRRYRRDLVDGRRLPRETVLSLTRRIAGMSYRERAGDPSIGRARARYVGGGCAILEAICGTWPVDELTVADRGLREGILHGLMAANGARGAASPPGQSRAP